VGSTFQAVRLARAHTKTHARVHTRTNTHKHYECIHLSVRRCVHTRAHAHTDTLVHTHAPAHSNCAQCSLLHCGRQRLSSAAHLWLMEVPLQCAVCAARTLKPWSGHRMFGAAHHLVLACRGNRRQRTSTTKIFKNKVLVCLLAVVVRARISQNPLHH